MENQEKTFLFANDQRSYSGKQIMNEVYRLQATTKDIRIRHIMKHTASKYSITISGDNLYRVCINKVILDIPYDEFFTLDLDNYIKIIRNRSDMYKNLNVTDTKFFLDFIIYMNKHKMKLNNFAIIEYKSGERILVTAWDEVRKYIKSLSSIEANFCIYDYIIPKKDIPEYLLISKSFYSLITYYMSTRNINDKMQYSKIVDAIRHGCKIEVYDPEKIYKY